MKFFIPLLLTLLWAGGSGTLAADPAYAPPASPRITYNFNPGWKLFVGDPANAQQAGFADSAWQNVTLPHAWNENDAFRVAIGSLGTGIAWYRKHFVLPSGSAGKKVFLEFEGIRQGGEFYVNGQWIGRHENGVMAAGFDITPYALPYPQENVVAVRTDNSYSYHEVATGSSFQWNSTSFYANYGGINKNVKLHLSGKTYQTLPLFSNLGTVGTYIYAQNISVPGKSAVIHADTQVRNEDTVAHTLTYQVVVADKDGILVADFSGGSATIQPGGTSTLTASATVTNLNFWSWGYGYLYDVYTIVKESGTVLDVVRTRTGFRKTQFTNGTVTLNDRAINIHGYAQRSTDEWPAIGTSVPAWMHDFSQRLVVDGGGNLMRWMHVTPGKPTVEACDRQGLMQAMPAGDSEGDVSDRRWDQRKEVMRDAIIYNRNNPSIIFYESGNDGISETHMIEMKAIRDQYDPLGGRAIGSREMMGSTNAEWGGEMLYINKSGTKPMWMTEYMRDEALRRYWDEFSPPYHPNGDYVHQNSDSIARENIFQWDQYFVQRPGTGARVNAGGVKIIFSDSNTHYRGYQNYRGSGVVDALRIPKDSWFVHRVMWDCWVDPTTPRAHIMGHWNYANGVVKSIYVASTAAYVELFSNGVSLGFGTKSLDFLFTWSGVAWSPGTLQAVGYDSAGNQICTDTRVTVGPATAIRLTPIFDPTGWKADGHDLALYEVEVMDAQGRRCPTDFTLINFVLSGPAEWRGGLAVRSDTVAGDNYILSTSLPVECGVNRVLVRSSTTAGTVTLTATAAGLTPATTNLDTIPFAVTNGLATLLPGDGMPASYSRGPTPPTPSYTVRRVPVAVTNITAGTSSSGSLNDTIDDNETTGWSSGSTLGQNWIQYTLARTALVSQVVLKFTGSPRDDIHPLSIQVNGTTAYSGTPPWTYGYVTIDLTPTSGNTVRIARTASGSLPLLEVEIYEAVVDGTPPAAPGDLTATPVSSTQINLAWTDNATDETSYKIEHSTDGVNFTTVATPPLNTTHYSDSGLTPLTTYYYRVRATKAGDESTGAVASATTPDGPPPVPGGFTATPGDGQISLSWNPSGSATSYVLLRSGTNGGPYTTTLASSSATSYVDTNVVNGTIYYYVVYAVGNGQSTYSVQAAATPAVGVGGSFWINTVTSAAQSWNMGTNWTDGTGFPNGPLAGANLTANITASQTVNLNAAITLGALALGTNGGAFTLAANGGSLTFDNGTDEALLLQVAASKGDSISAPITSNRSLKVQNDSANPLTLSGLIAGGTDAGITFDGAVVLSGANTFGGDTFTAGGTLKLANSLALQNSTLYYEAGNLAFSGITAATLGGLSGSNAAPNLTLVNVASAPVALTVGGNNRTTSYEGGLGGAGSLIKAGTGSLTLANATYTGSTTIAAASGNLTVTGGSFGSASATITLGLGNALNLTGGTATAANVNIGVVGGQTGAGGAIGGNASAIFNALSMGASGNTAGSFTINTTGSTSLGTVAVRRNAGSVTTPSQTLGLIIANGTVTAASVTIAQGGVAGRGADLNINGGSVTIADSSATGKFSINASGGNGFVTMTGGSLTYLGTDGLLLSVGPGVSALSIRGGTATLSGVTLNSGNAIGVPSSLVVSNGGTLYLGGVGLIAKRPGAVIFASLGNGGATMGAIADWSSLAPLTLAGTTTFKAADASGVPYNISLGGALTGVGGLAKTGAGLLTLSGTSSYGGGTTVSAGTLILSGNVTSGNAVTVQAAGTLNLSAGTLTAGSTTIDAGGTLTGCGTINGALVNNGTIVSTCGGALIVSGNVTNNGTMRMTHGSTIVAGGTFTNNGILDLLTGARTLPVNFVNNGTVLDSSDVKLSSWSVEGTAFTLRIAGYLGHEYTLQTTADLTAGWTNLETRPGVTGQELVFTHDPGPAPRCFYRIVINP